MNKALPLIGLGLGATAVVLALKGSSLANMAKNLTYTIRLDGKPKLYAGGLLNVISSLVLKGNGSVLRIPVAIDFENRSDEEITVGVNALFVYYKGTRMATNGVTPSSVTIKKFAKSTMGGLNLDVEVASLVQVAGDVVKTWLTNQDFASLTKDVSVELSGVINNTFVINLTRALGEQTTVSTDTGVAGVDDVLPTPPDGYEWVDGGELNGRLRKRLRKLAKKVVRKLNPVTATKDALRTTKMAVKATINPVKATKTALKTTKRNLNPIKATKNAVRSIGVRGLGLVAAKDRKIKNIGDYVAYIPGQENLKRSDLVAIADGTVRDTAELMHKVVDTYYSDVTELAGRLKRDTLKDTLQNIWNFVYTYIQYVPDSRIMEQVRRPLRTLYDQKGDCDCYATLIGAMLKNMGIDFRFRIAAYSAGRYQHVYVIVPSNDSPTGYYVVDPVLDQCFAEKAPSKFFDV